MTWTKDDTDRLLAAAPDLGPSKGATIREITTAVREFFDDDAKAGLWMGTPNPLLGDVSPNDMLAAGREEKLLRFVRQAVLVGQACAENGRPDSAPGCSKSRDAHDQRDRVASLMRSVQLYKDRCREYEADRDNAQMQVDALERRVAETLATVRDWAGNESAATEAAWKFRERVAVLEACVAEVLVTAADYARGYEADAGNPALHPETAEELRRVAKRFVKLGEDTRVASRGVL